MARAARKWQIIEPPEFECTSNAYHIGGKRYLRVTHTLSIIGKPGLVAWFLKVGKKEADRVRTNRQNLGTRVHKLIELDLKGAEYSLKNDEDEVKEDLELFSHFKKDCKLVPEGLEQHLWSNKYDYAGTADFIGKYVSNEKYKVRGHTLLFTKPAQVLIDWKTAKVISDEYWLQMAAYMVAFEELTGIKLKGAVIVQIRFGKIKIREKTYDELIEEFDAYLAALKLYKWKHKKWNRCY